MIWEYAEFTSAPAEDPIAFLNAKGHDGWEAVDIHCYQLHEYAGRWETRVVFKRRTDIPNPNPTHSGSQSRLVDDVALHSYLNRLGAPHKFIKELADMGYEIVKTNIEYLKVGDSVDLTIHVDRSTIRSPFVITEIGPRGIVGWAPVPQEQPKF